MAKAKSKPSKGKLDKADRRVLATMWVTTGHLITGALVLKPIYLEGPFNPTLAILGILSLAWAYFGAIILMEGGEE